MTVNEHGKEITPGTATAMAVRSRLRTELGREPTHKEIAKELGLPKPAVDYLIAGKPMRGA